MKPARKTKEFILQQDTHEERWWMTRREHADRTLTEQARGDDEFLVFPSDEDGQTELGIVVYRDGRVSNRWGDGTVGVPDRWVELANAEETMVTFAGDDDGGWHDVLVDTEGRFVDWAD